MPSLWSEAAGYMASKNLSKELRMAVKPGLRFRQFADIKDPDQQQRHKGAPFHLNVYSKLTADSGETSRALDETKVMPTGNFTITQGTLTITERGMSVPYTGKYDDLSEQPVKEIIHQILKRDCKEAMDKDCAAEFAKTPLRVVPTGGNGTAAVTLTTNGTATLTNTIALGKLHVKTIVDLMKERDIPAYTDDDYYCIAWPTTFRTFKNDLESIKQYTDAGFGHIMRGEIGRYENCRFVEQTNVPKTSLSTAAAAWAQALSNWAVFFGSDTVAEAVAVPEEIRGKIPGDVFIVVPISSN
jgi:N4-gp56 family major capsid protein